MIVKNAKRSWHWGSTGKETFSCLPDTSVGQLKDKIGSKFQVKNNISLLFGFMLQNLTCISCVSWLQVIILICNLAQADKGLPAQVPASQLVLFCNGKLLQVGYLATMEFIAGCTNYRCDENCCSRKRTRGLSGRPEFAVGARYWRAGLSSWLSLSIWFHLYI